MRMVKSRVSLRGLRTFCIVAKHESFRLAAEELFLTPSAISHQVRSLEEELSVKLFDRNTRVPRLTEAGNTLLQECEHLIAQLDDVTGQFRALYTLCSLRISVQPFFATEILLPRLNSFLSQNPSISISIDTEDQTAEKHPAQADVSIRLFRKLPAELKTNILFKLRLVPACAPHLADQRHRGKLAVTQGLPLIVHSKRPNAWRDWSRASGIEVDTKTNSIRLETMISVARAAEQGLGVALVPLPLSESWFHSGKLQRLSEYELKTPDQYILAYREEDEIRTEVQLFSNWILNEFSEYR
ncbi:MAG: LysR substrate-binding domain-containing protein [Pseudomonadales bacterium]